MFAHRFAPPAVPPAVAPAAPPAAPAHRLRHGQRRRALLLPGLTAALLAACANPPPPAPPPPLGLAEVVARPGERALLEGIRAYDDGQYAQAEDALQRALRAGLQSPRDQAHAHKLLAFIRCTSERPAECEAAFRAARLADPGFELTRAEAGHPLWGPVYERLSR